MATEILALVPDATDVWTFHGKQQEQVDAQQKVFNDHLTLVPVSRAAKNALDFHLSFYMGYITSRNPDARFVVIANDQGYGPMLDHAKELGFDARQVGFGPTPKKIPAKRAPTKTPKVGSTTSAASAKPVAVEHIGAICARYRLKFRSRKGSRIASTSLRRHQLAETDKSAICA